MIIIFYGFQSIMQCFPLGSFDFVNRIFKRSSNYPLVGVNFH